MEVKGENVQNVRDEETLKVVTRQDVRPMSKILLCSSEKVSVEEGHLCR